MIRLLIGIFALSFISAGAQAQVAKRDVNACMKAVKKTTNDNKLSVLGTETSEANETVYVGVGEQKARWKCLVKRGIVAEVSSMVDEGQL